MGQLLVRGVDDALVQALKSRAARTGRSVEAEHRAILEDALRPEEVGFFERAAQLCAATPPQSSDAADLIRQDRDRDLTESL